MNARVVRDGFDACGEGHEKPQIPRKTDLLHPLSEGARFQFVLRSHLKNPDRH